MLAMVSRAPRFASKHALSLTTIASVLAPTGEETTHPETVCSSNMTTVHR